LKLHSVGNELRFAWKQTDAQAKRNNNMRKAKDLIDKHVDSKNKTVVIEWGKGKKEDRTITVDGVIVFTQSHADVIGTFAGAFRTIKLE
jgi:acyl-CoA reductase-like NAD-dependent aldehyde dehydrogenase